MQLVIPEIEFTDNEDISSMYEAKASSKYILFFTVS